MDQGRNRMSNRLRKSPRKTSDTFLPISTPSHLMSSSGNVMPSPPFYDHNCASLGNQFSRMNMNERMRSQMHHKYGQPDSPQRFLLSPTPSIPFTDLVNHNNRQSHSPMFFSRSRTSSFLRMDNDSPRNTFCEDSNQNYPVTRSYSSAAVERPYRRSGIFSNYDNEYTPKQSRSTSSMSSKINRKTTSPILPQWALDANGILNPNVQLSRVVESGDLVKFAMDKAGCQYLQEVVTDFIPNHLKVHIFEQIIEKREVFLKLSVNMFGNFFVQQIMNLSATNQDRDYRIRQEKIKENIASKMTDLCMDKSACRVVQHALDTLDLPLASNLVSCLPRDPRLVSICVDQNANHVIQKVVSTIPLKNWEFIVDFVALPNHLRQICSDKYGCRVVQTIIEKLTVDSMNEDLTAAQNLREIALQRLMSSVMSNCAELASNEYANYIVQHIVSSDDMAVYREAIIEKCLMRNLLSLSQEKFASHVVEKALLHAPLGLLTEMMDEIFDGYVPHPETGKDALDIMMFHQFGNYVVQCMLTICCDAVAGKRETKEGSYNHMNSFQTWLKKLQSRVIKEKNRLSRFSSGKKMLLTLENLNLIDSMRFSRSCQGSDYNTFSTASEDEMKSEDEGSYYLENRDFRRMRFENEHSVFGVRHELHDHDGDDESN